MHFCWWLDWITPNLNFIIISKYIFDKIHKVDNAPDKQANSWVLKTEASGVILTQRQQGWASLNTK